MVDEHYGHLADEFMKKTVRDTAPSFGVASEGKAERRDKATT